MIPKIIYQTWKTKELPPGVVAIRKRIQELNPEYTMELFDDNDIDDFIKTNFNEKIYSCFSQLNVGAAKADFWRYCILYKNGGVYLDIDSEITAPLRDLIQDTDQCIITREKNPGIFCNWILIFEPKHPIMIKTILNCCHNIIHRSSSDLLYLTGPRGPYRKAILDTANPIYRLHIKPNDIYNESDAIVNSITNAETLDTRCRFYMYDLGKFAKFKHESANELYITSTHWTKENCIYKSN